VQLCWIMTPSRVEWLVEVCSSLHKLEDSDIQLARRRIYDLPIGYMQTRSALALVRSNEASLTDAPLTISFD
jgi:hypothetical protein